MNDRSRSVRNRWILQDATIIVIFSALLYVFHAGGASDVMIIGTGAFLFGVLIFFNFIALRNYYLIPYTSAAARLRRLIQGDLQDTMNPSIIPEANDLVDAINELSSELRAQKKMIEKLERMRIDFVANVSHELKTPLTSIKGYTETLKDGALKDLNVSQKFLARIEENADRLIAIIGDLLLLSKVESFPHEIDWKIFETAPVAQKLDTTFMPAFKKKNQTLNVQFDDAKLEGDAKKLEQVFINLIDNATRYCPDNATIELRQSSSPLHWHVFVKDDGPGIPIEHQSRIFERFYRVDADRSRETGGTGLGLAIVKHIMMLHDGSITLESEPGKGTNFNIRWPRRAL